MNRLDIDPRAMRMGSRELADTILELIRQAQRDVESRGQQQITEFLGDNSVISDREMIGKQLQNATTDLRENLRSATEVLERFQDMLRR